MIDLSKYAKKQEPDSAPEAKQDEIFRPAFGKPGGILEQMANRHKVTLSPDHPHREAGEKYVAGTLNKKLF